MTTITSNLIIDEEFRSPSTGTADNEVAALSNATLQAYVLGLNSTSHTGFPQFAERGDMITGVPQGASLSLVADANGAAFPTSGTGIATGISDLNGNAISLFRDATNANIVLGKDASGEVSFAVVLDGVKVYVVQFEALTHPLTGQVDSADFHDLEGLIFVQTATTVTTELNFSDFRDVASGQTEFAMIAPDQAPAGQAGAIQILATATNELGQHSTVNVSTQGGFNGSLGSGSQAVGVNESLIFDIVTGGDTVYTQDESHDAANIQFGTHTLDIKKAEFGIVQTNPNNASVDVLLSAYNVKSASDAVDGAAFITNSLNPANQDAVIIDSVTIIQKNGTTTTYLRSAGDVANIVDWQDNGTVILNNLKDDWLVEFTTTTPLDRFVTKNVGTDNEQFDIGRIGVTASSSETVKEFDDLGVHLHFEDDGPLATLAIKSGAAVVVDESLTQNAGEDETASLGKVTVLGSVLFTSTVDAGADQPATTGDYVLSLGAGNGTDSGLDDTTTGQNIVLVKVDNHTVEGRVGTTSGATALKVEINSSGDVTLTQLRAVVHNDPNDPDEAGASAATFTSGALLVAQTVADKDTDPATSNAVDLGQVLKIEDDGPSISTPANRVISGQAVGNTGDVAITASFGSDGAGAISLNDLPDGWAYDNAAQTSASLTIGGVKTYQITVDNDSYRFDVLAVPATEFLPLNFAAIASGGPQEILSVPTTSTADNTIIKFDGLIFANTANPLDPANNLGAASALDDGNPNNVGFGVKNDQASQMNNNEGFLAQNAANTGSGDLNEINGLKFDIAGIGNLTSVDVQYWFVDDGVVVGTNTVQNFALPSGNNTATFTIHRDTSFDQVYVRFFYDGEPNPNNVGVRVENFAIELPKPVPDQTFDFGLKIVDGEPTAVQDSKVTTQNFLIGVDGTDADSTVSGVVV